VRSIFSLSAYDLVFATEIRFKINNIHLKVKSVKSSVSLKKLDVSIIANRDLDFLLLLLLLPPFFLFLL